MRPIRILLLLLLLLPAAATMTARQARLVARWRTASAFSNAANPSLGSLTGTVVLPPPPRRAVGIGP